MWFVRMIIHLTMSKLYFSWLNLHFVSWLSFELACCSNSVFYSNRLYSPHMLNNVWKLFSNSCMDHGILVAWPQGLGVSSPIFLASLFSLGSFANRQVAMIAMRNSGKSYPLLCSRPHHPLCLVAATQMDEGLFDSFNWILGQTILCGHGSGISKPLRLPVQMKTPMRG